MSQTAEDVASFRSLIRFDWLVTKSWNRLHFADLSDAQVAEMEENCLLYGSVTLSCGRTAAMVSIPGIFTRMGAPRCIRCCQVRGYPLGNGSPKNDDACRVLLGLEVPA